MNRVLIVTPLLCIAWLGLVSCSSSTGTGADSSTSALTVKTNSLACTTNDGIETDVVCEVAVANVQVSQNAVTFAINAFVLDLLSRNCGGYAQNPLLDGQAFNDKVKAELSATVAKSGTGWSVGSVACSGSHE